MLVFGARIYHHQVAVVQRLVVFDIVQNIGIVPASHDTIVRGYAAVLGKSIVDFSFQSTFISLIFLHQGCHALHGANMPVSTDLGSDFHACNFRLIFYQPHFIDKAINIGDGIDHTFAALQLLGLIKPVNQLIIKAGKHVLFTKNQSWHHLINFANGNRFIRAKICGCPLKPYPFTIPNLT